VAGQSADLTHAVNETLAQYARRIKARYFATGKIRRDQAEDYALRKGMSLDAIERWLPPNLAYD